MSQPGWKPEASEIGQFVATLADSLGLDKATAWWPRFVYHSARVENVAKILNHGSLLSRRRAYGEGLLSAELDSAAQGIIAGLSDAETSLVRLYFRPRTPTQYRNEGIRPIAKIWAGAHMPVPVYLLFDAASVLARAGTSFTTGRLTLGSERGDDLAFLQSMEFKKIFHEGPYNPKKQGDIKNARHAEVLVPDELPLDGHLRFVVCRSAPERDTLRSLLDPEVWAKWKDRIILEGGRLIFQKRGTFMESVSLAPAATTFKLYSLVDYGFDGPFDVEFFCETAEGRIWSAHRPGYCVDGRPISLKLPEPTHDYRVRVTVDGHLSYQGQYAETEEPEIY